MKETKSTCCYCGVGCGVIVRSDGARIIAVRGDPEHPANFGRLCTKGANLHVTAASGGRALHPELRELRGEPRRRVDWDAALSHAAARFAQTIGAHGPDSVAFYVSGQLLTEDYYVFNKLAKGLVGTNNIDTNSRLCMSSAVAGYKATLGADAPPACYEDLERADCILVAGSNAAIAHPVLWRRVEDARERNPRLKVVVVDPRRTETAAAADLHLQIVAGTDLALFNAMLHVLVAEKMIDRAYIVRHTQGFDALARSVRTWTPEAAAAVTGVPARDIVAAARWFGRARAALSLYCQGLNQSTHGTHNNAALVNLHLATGQIGRPGAGPFSLTGQPNAMGGREVGGMASLLSAHRDLADAGDRAEVARLWGVPSVPASPGKTAVELFRALADGEVRAVWIACTNPAQSMPDTNLVRRALARADFVVVQESYRGTETAEFADLLLPASSWGEKEGTVTNSERRITRVRAAVPAPGEARPDWEIAVDFARRLGERLGRCDAGRLFPYTHPEQIFDEHRETTRGRDLDITGLSYAVLESAGPQQWPFPQGAAAGKARLYEEGIFPTVNGRARFVITPHRPARESPDAAHAFRLNTGRLRDQWHGMSRTGTAAILFGHTPEPRLSMHPQDLRSLGLRDGDAARVANARGELTLEVEADPGLRRGDVYLPMHWGSRFMGGAGVNALTLSAFDPVSKQPELKSAAVSVARAELPHELAVMARVDALGWDGVERLRERLRGFALVAVSLFGPSPCVRLRARSAEPFDAQTLAAVDGLLAAGGAPVEYRDPARKLWKRLWLRDGRLECARVSGEPAATDALERALAGDIPVSPAALMAPGRRQPPGRIVCLCLDVSEAKIRAAVASGADLQALQETLKCGTGCGSCVTELRRLCAEPGAFSFAA